MKTLVIGDPSGSHCAQLIEKKNIIPEDDRKIILNHMHETYLQIDKFLKEYKEN